MQKISVMLTVYFEDPFWVGMVEVAAEGKMQVYKITFGPEPKDYEVYQYLQAHAYSFTLSPPVALDKKSFSPMNPKRMKKKIHQMMAEKKHGTKSQEAFKMQISCWKQEKKRQQRMKKEQDKERQFILRQKKKKEKHKGH